MSTYYTSSSDQRDAAPVLYLREHAPTSHAEESLLPGNNNMSYVSSGFFSTALTGNPQQQSNGMDMSSVGGLDSMPQHQAMFSSLGGSQMSDHGLTGWRDGRNEMLFMQPMASHSTVLQDGQNLQGQGLSLSLGTHIPSGIHIPSGQYRSQNLGLTAFLSPNSSKSAESNSRNGSTVDEQPRSAEFFPHSLVGANQDLNTGNFSVNGMSSMSRMLSNSRYLRAAQQLLDEVVNVRKALKHSDSEKIKKSEEGDEDSKKDVASNPQESDGNSTGDLSQAERQELQSKLAKLSSMLDEVDRRYKQYYYQMQIVVSSFDMIAGPGAAKPYTALALQTISRHFRSLRDAITTQIQATRKSLGEQDASGSGKGVGIPRLRYLDQQLRQQRALQQLGMMQQHAWRPQRGLPESSVSILRAWLFEHFLHPYPKDSDKIMLARQTGLTRSQVSNWFINARVRLWKPMVEEMYKEEIGDAEMDSNSSSDTAKPKIGDVKEDRVEEVQQSSTATQRCSSGQLMDSTFDRNPDVEMAGHPGGFNYLNGRHGDVEAEYGQIKLNGEQAPGFEDCGLYQNSMVHSGSNNGRFVAATAAYQMAELGRFGGGSGVSLTLGLQHCEGGTLPVSAGPHGSFLAMRGDDLYNQAASSIGPETTEFESINIGNQQQRFGSTHLLHDFVA
ncbi:hypothetical protein BT93_I1386 [Corymbia citriodora subsp. variegata]|nr:hypothetical protein BT93_I1386 [Corymbia citriodora subsp. variegata]KAF8013527.1 hypothetical protein BT93_I1386 [Corymbia citriodora subsp. variegata]